MLLDLLDAVFVRCLRAAAEALYPPSHNGAPDAEATELARRDEAYIRALPPSSRLQVMALYVAIELFAPILAPGGSFFSWRTPARRLAAVQGWRHSRIYPLRLLGNAVHAQLSMIYLSHPAVVAFIGEYKPVAYPGDAFQVEIRPVPEAP